MRGVKIEHERKLSALNYAVFFWKHEVLIFYLFLISGTNVIGAQSAPGSKNLAPPEMLLVEPSHPTKYALVVYAF